MVLKSCDLHNRPVTAVSQLTPVVSIREISLSGLSNKLNRLLIHSGTALPSLLRDRRRTAELHPSSGKTTRCPIRYQPTDQNAGRRTGSKAFRRTKRSVKLTAAGHAFLREANDILYRVEKSRVEARRAEQGETGTLSIGCVSWTTSLFLPELIRAYRIRYPGVRIDLRELTPAQQLEALEVGSIDVGFTGRLPQPWARRLEQERIYPYCVMVALPKRHALAGSRKISLEKLAKEDWVFLDPNPAPEIVRRFTLLCTNAGFATSHQ